MNLQAMMKQAQALQKDMLKVKEEIDKKEFIGESSLVKVTMMGNKQLTKVEIESDDNITSDDIEMLQDMIVLAVNQAIKQIDDETNEKMGKFGSIPGMF